MTRGGLALALLLLTGCGAIQRMTVPVPEYDAYRRFRLSSSVERKLSAGYEYLRAYPRGTYKSEVAFWFGKAVPAYVDRSWNDPVRLRSFLAAAPAGPDAERAARRLVELELTEQFRTRRERAFDAKVAGLQERLARAEAGRRRLVSEVVAWTRRLASIHTWGGRTSELDSEFIYAYRLVEPSARCTDEGCAKTVTVRYSVPEGKAQSEREAVYDVGLRLERGGVRGAWITGPELFTRLGEAVRVAAVAPTDWVGRAESIGQASQLLALAIEPVLPQSRCSADAVSPVVLHRICDGVELKVISALDVTEEDRVVIEPVETRAAP